MNVLELNVFKFFLTSQICNKETAVSVFSKLKNDANLENCPSFVECVDAVNNFIKMYDLEVVEGKSEISGEDFFALVQVCETTVTQNARFHDKKVSALLSKLLTTIVLSENGFITETDAVNLSSEVEMSRGNAERSVGDLIAQKWLEEKDGIIYLGPRSVLELGQLLASSYPNVSKQCPLCKKTLFFGTSCNSCHGKIHLHCLKKYWEQSKTCPSCKKASSMCFDDAQGSEDSPPKPKRRRRTSD